MMATKKSKKNGKRNTEVDKLQSTVAIEPTEIGGDMVMEIKKLVTNGKRPALTLEVDGFCNEREITSPVTKESLAAQINDLRTTMGDTPLPWTLMLIHPYVDPFREGLHVDFQHTFTLAEFVS